VKLFGGGLAKMDTSKPDFKGELMAIILITTKKKVD
jgi:hypothetical protein